MRSSCSSITDVQVSELLRTTQLFRCHKCSSNITAVQYHQLFRHHSCTCITVVQSHSCLGITAVHVFQLFKHRLLKQITWTYIAGIENSILSSCYCERTTRTSGTSAAHASKLYRHHSRIGFTAAQCSVTMAAQTLQLLRQHICVY